jgi:hypothetical protein
MLCQAYDARNARDFSGYYAGDFWRPNLNRYLALGQVAPHFAANSKDFAEFFHPLFWAYCSPRGLTNENLQSARFSFLMDNIRLGNAHRKAR